MVDTLQGRREGRENGLRRETDERTRAVRRLDFNRVRRLSLSLPYADVRGTSYAMCQMICSSITNGDKHTRFSVLPICTDPDKRQRSCLLLSADARIQQHKR